MFGFRLSKARPFVVYFKVYLQHIKTRLFALYFEAYSLYFFSARQIDIHGATGDQCQQRSMSHVLELPMSWNMSSSVNRGFGIDVVEYGKGTTEILRP